MVQVSGSTNIEAQQSCIISQAVVSPVTDNRDSYINDSYISNTSASMSYDTYSYASAVVKSDTGIQRLYNTYLVYEKEYMQPLLEQFFMSFWFIVAGGFQTSLWDNFGVVVCKWDLGLVSSVRAFKELYVHIFSNKNSKLLFLYCLFCIKM